MTSTQIVRYIVKPDFGHLKITPVMCQSHIYV
jgi:hypothetical protein